MSLYDNRARAGQSTGQQPRRRPIQRPKLVVFGYHLAQLPQIRTSACLDSSAAGPPPFAVALAIGCLRSKPSLVGADHGALCFGRSLPHGSLPSCTLTDAFHHQISAIFLLDPLLGHLVATVATTALPLSNQVPRFTPGTAHAHILDSPALTALLYQHQYI